ncbi:MAG: GNAT family N-acetyltransferase [Candidatus Kerfeldbacteria bacterium]|nr:GNAT family N-acetyltransferase [Candidatus Kerfeldbacteria bacterium]
MNQTVANPPFLVGEKVTLRPVNPDTDLDPCWRWVNDPDIRPLISRRVPVSREEEREWIVRRSPSDIVFSIELNPDRRLIGVISLHRIDWINRHAASGTIIGEADSWGKGYGTEAKTLLLGYAFRTLGLHRVSSSVFATNERSLRCQLKCGYVEEGRRRKAYFINGEWVDEVLLGVLADEWLVRFPSALHKRLPTS